jgi:hypothetical protein
MNSKRKVIEIENDLENEQTIMRENNKHIKMKTNNNSNNNTSSNSDYDEGDVNDGENQVTNDCYYDVSKVNIEGK